MPNLYIATAMLLVLTMIAALTRPLPGPDFMRTSFSSADTSNDPVAAGALSPARITGMTVADTSAAPPWRSFEAPR